MPVPSDLLFGLRSCRRVSMFISSFMMVILWDSFPLVTWAKGDPNFLEVLIRNYKQCLGKSSPYLLVLLFHDEEYLEGISSLLSDGISFVAIFNLIM